MDYSNLLNKFSSGVFQRMRRKQLELESSGRRVYNLFVGTPDFAPSGAVIRAVEEAAANPENYKYSLIETPKLLEAVISYYSRRYNVALTPDMITACNGTQDGIGHVGMALCNPGDLVLLPDPCYPAFETGAIFGEAKIVRYPLIAENGFLPRFDLLGEDVLRQIKYTVLSYPSNPCGAVAPKSVYAECIAAAKKYGFAIISDNAYSDIIFDGREGFSYLSLAGAADVGLEFFSLSKSFNMSGLRCSFAIGNREMIAALRKIRSQYDFGMPLIVQYGAIAALSDTSDTVERQCLEYERRRNALCGGLRRIGWDVPNAAGTMFVWARVPERYADGDEMAAALLERAGVLCTPGSEFGACGKMYVRFALVHPVEILEEVVGAIAASGVV